MAELFEIMVFHIPDVLDLFVGKKDAIINLDGLRFSQDKGLQPYVKAWTKKDFIPTVDNYFGKAALIAQLILQGERTFPGI